MRGDARSLSAARGSESGLSGHSPALAGGGAIRAGKRLSRLEEEAQQHRGRFSSVLPSWNTANDSARKGCIELTGIHWNLLELKRIHWIPVESKAGVAEMSLRFST